MFLVVEGGATTAVGAVGHGLPTGVLREAGVQLVLVLHLGVDVVGLDVGVGVLVDVGRAVGRLQETLPRPPSKAVLADLSHLKYFL